MKGRGVDLAFCYCTSDPEFGRTLWRALLSTSGQDDTGLATPERLAQTRAIWLGFVSNAVRDGYLADDIPAELVMHSMAHVTGGVLLSWAMGGLSTSALTATVGIGYALCLKGSATAQGQKLLQSKIEAYQAQLSKAGPHVTAHAPETL